MIGKEYDAKEKGGRGVRKGKLGGEEPGQNDLVGQPREGLVKKKTRKKAMTKGNFVTERASDLSETAGKGKKKGGSKGIMEKNRQSTHPHTNKNKPPGNRGFKRGVVGRKKVTHEVNKFETLG